MNKVIEGKFTKVNKASKTAYGWAYVSTIKGVLQKDHSGDTWKIEEIEKTAHEFMECRMGGECHEEVGGAILVESIVFSKEKQDALGIDLGMEGWFVGFLITDPDLLEKVEKGELSMFSIGGTGIREEVEA